MLLLKDHTVSTIMWWNQILLSLEPPPLRSLYYLYRAWLCKYAATQEEKKCNPNTRQQWKGPVYWMLGVAQTGSNSLWGIWPRLLQDLHSKATALLSLVVPGVNTTACKQTHIPRCHGRIKAENTTVREKLYHQVKYVLQHEQRKHETNK